MKYGKKKAAALGMLLVCGLLSGCGCGKKNGADESGEKVLQITITPEPSPTMSPEEANPDAVVTNGNITMVNEYLAGKAGSAGTEGADRTEDAAGTDGAEDSAE